MNLQKKTLLQFNNLSINFDYKAILDDVSGAILDNSKIGLVGINGSGKSTFLKALAGILPSYEGGISTNQSVEYVQQIDLEAYRLDEFLYSYLESLFPEWWNALSIYEDIFGKALSEGMKVKNLSGGELVKLHISVALAKSPQILLLDEPTNHLDLSSLRKLEKFLKSTDIAFIIVSHNVQFLNKVIEEVWELNEGKISVFGGNYDFYRQKKVEEIDSKKRQYEVKKKEQRKLLVSARKDRDRSLRNLKKGAMMHSPGEDKFFKGFFGNNSQKKAGKNKLAFDNKQEELSKDLERLKIKERKLIYLDLNINRKKGLVISISDGKLTLPNDKILISDINVSLYHGERIAILGENGSGKTTLSKQLEYNNNSLLKGDINYGSKYKTLFVDQKYDVVSPDLTLIENLRERNKSINYENSRRLLSNLGFLDESVINRKAKTLSGGETSRLAFAIATSAVIDVLILDEPTNNLDIETVEVISEALASYDGTLIVISHDVGFLKNINIDKYYSICDWKVFVSDNI